MGTRHLICVVQDGKFRVAQYGQWDGYPTGQGEDIRKFLVREWADDKLAFFKEHVSKLEIANDEAVHAAREAYPKTEDFKRWFPQFDRDTGAKILDYILRERTSCVYLNPEFGADSLMCEWAYVIDLDRDILEIYKGFNKEPVPITNRFMSYKTVGEYDRVKLIREFQIADLAGQRQLMGRVEEDPTKMETV